MPEEHFTPRQPGWDSELARERAKLRTHFKQFKRTGTGDAWEKYRTLRNEFRRALRAKRKSALEKFSSNTWGLKAVSSLLKTLQSGNKKSLEIIATQECSPNDTLRELMGTHFPGCVKRLPESDRRGNKLASRINLEDKRCSFITIERLKYGIRRAKPMSAPGPDGIKPFVLRQLGQKMLGRVCRLMRASLLMGYMPEPFRRSRAISS